MSTKPIAVGTSVAINTVKGGKYTISPSVMEGLHSWIDRNRLFLSRWQMGEGGDLGYESSSSGTADVNNSFRPVSIMKIIPELRKSIAQVIVTLPSLLINIYQCFNTHSYHMMQNLFYY